MTAEKLALDCVHFPINSDAISTPSEEDLQKFFATHPELFPDEDTSRAQIETTYRREYAQWEAMKKANDFIYHLYEKELEVSDPTMNRVAAAYGGQWLSLGEFFVDAIPVDTPVPKEVLEAGKNFKDGNSFSMPIGSDEAVYVLLLRGHVPPHFMDYEQARSRVEKRFRNHEYLRQFMQHAQEVRKKIANGLAADPKAFESEAIKQGCQVEHFDHFTITALPDSFEEQQVNALRGLNTGDISECILHKPDVQIIHVRHRKIPSPEEASEMATAIDRENRTRTSQLFLHQLIEEMIVDVIGEK
jgi:hypothetical protein